MTFMNKTKDDDVGEPPPTNKRTGHKKRNVDHYTIKCRLSSILRFPELEKLIKTRVDITNRIWTEAYFLFNLHVLRLLTTNQKVEFDDVTLTRCALFVIDKQNTIRGKLSTRNEKTSKDFETISLEETYLQHYRPLRKNKNNNYLHPNYANIKSVKRPLEYLAIQMKTNILNHIQINFSKYQHKYLMAKWIPKLVQFQLSKRNQRSIINIIQYHVNNKHSNITIFSKVVKKLDNLTKIMDVVKRAILVEKTIMPKNIIGNTKNGALKKHLFPLSSQVIPFLLPPFHI